MSALLANPQITKKTRVNNEYKKITIGHFNIADKNIRRRFNSGQNNIQ